MRFFRIVIRLVFLALIALFLHYTLPQRDIVQITSTEVIRTDLTSFNKAFFASRPSQSNTGVETRDLRLINTQMPQGPLLGFIPRADTTVMVYRNEDTGFWPPYLKYDSSDLQAEAASYERSEQWYSITHYGWRNNFFSIYPNATSIEPVNGPDDTSFPWFNAVILLVLLIIFIALRHIWTQFYDRTIEPIVQAVQNKSDAFRAKVSRK